MKKKSARYLETDHQPDLVLILRLFGWLVWLSVYFIVFQPIFILIFKQT